MLAQTPKIIKNRGFWKIENLEKIKKTCVFKRFRVVFGSLAALFKGPHVDIIE